jgi:hypothetical protein
MLRERMPGMMKLVGFAMLLAACGGSPRTCSPTPDLSLVPGCVWDAVTCACEGEDMHISTDCSPMPCGANSSFDYVTCQCTTPDFSVPE